MKHKIYKKLASISANVLEEGDKTSATFTIPVNITANVFEEGDIIQASILAGQAVELASDIPPDAKKAVKDFICEKLASVKEDVSELIITIPDELTQYSEIIVEIISRFLS